MYQKTRRCLSTSPCFVSFCGKGGIDFVAASRLLVFPFTRRGAPCKTSLRKALINQPPYFLLLRPTNEFVRVVPKNKKMSFDISLLRFVLRKGRDSNPRYSYPYTAFRVRPDRPLRHLSLCVLRCKCTNLFLNYNYFNQYFALFLRKTNGKVYFYEYMYYICNILNARFGSFSI